MSIHRGAKLFTLGVVSLAAVACRQDSSTPTHPTTGQYGGPGTGYKAQCTGWFPDWISSNPPPDNTPSFMLSQGYFLGIPNFATVDGQLKVVSWSPPSPATSVADAPWLAYDFHVPAQQMNYLNALKTYLLQGNPEVDFVAQNNAVRPWFEVPMMTESATRREPYHGLTAERHLLASEQPWMTPGSSLESYAIGEYNALGSYTIGQVFNSPNAALSDPSKAKFIDGTFVFKLLFAEYDPTKINPASDPMTGAPDWQVQDVANPSATTLKHARLLQVDVAVRDPRSTTTGWVFATFVYDKSLIASQPVSWARLTPVGLQWGDDPGVTSPAGIKETWLNPNIPAVFQNHTGRNGRLDGPVDNPASSCVSCHSTSEVAVGGTTVPTFRGADIVPPASCNATQQMTWFRNIMGGTPFGYMAPSGSNYGCDLASPQPPTPPLYSLDYSLQLADGLQSALYYKNPNACQSAPSAMAMMAKAHEGAAASENRRTFTTGSKRVAITDDQAKLMQRTDEGTLRR